MNHKLKQIIYGGLIAAMILTLFSGCKFGAKSNVTADNSFVQDTNSAPASNETVKTKNKYFWGGWLVQNNKKYTKTQFVFDPNKEILINYDYGNDSPPDDKLEEAKYDHIDRDTVKITLSNKKTMTAKLSPEGDVMTIDNFKGESLTLKLTSNRMMYAVCKAKPKSCGYPYDK